MKGELEAAVAFAERERDEAHAAFRRALHAYTEADLRLLSARLDLSEHEAQTSDTTNRKA